MKRTIIISEGEGCLWSVRAGEIELARDVLFHEAWATVNAYCEADTSNRLSMPVWSGPEVRDDRSYFTLDYVVRDSQENDDDRSPKERGLPPPSNILPRAVVCPSCGVRAYVYSDEGTWRCEYCHHEGGVV